MRRILYRPAYAISMLAGVAAVLSPVIAILTAR